MTTAYATLDLTWLNPDVLSTLTGGFKGIDPPIPPEGMDTFDDNLADDDYLTLAQAAIVSGRSTDTVHEWYTAEEVEGLEVTKEGKSAFFIKRESLRQLSDRFLAPSGHGTIDEKARQLNSSPDTVSTMFQDGKLPGILVPYKNGQERLYLQT